MFELTASVLGGEPPVYNGGGLVAFAFERSRLSDASSPTRQTLSLKTLQLDFSHVQPASVIGCVVLLMAFASQRAAIVGVETVSRNCGLRNASSTNHFI